MKKVCILLLGMALLSSCGYGFQGGGSVLPDDVNTIVVRVAENNTTEPGLGLRFAVKLRSRFDRYGAVKVVDSEDDADAELITVIKSVETRVRAVTGASDFEVEQELIMTVRSELRMMNGQILYRNENLQATSSFGSTSETVVTSSSQFAQAGIDSDTLDTLGSREVSRGQKNIALEEAMEEAARILYLDSVAEDF